MCSIALSSFFFFFFLIILDFILTLRCLFYSYIYLWHAQQISVSVLTDDEIIYYLCGISADFLSGTNIFYVNDDAKVRSLIRFSCHGLLSKQVHCYK